MPGEEFFPNAPQLGTMRLNFSHAGDAADGGLSILSHLLANPPRGAGPPPLGDSIP